MLLTATGAGGAFRAAFNTSAASLDICPGALSERTEGKLAAAGRGYIHTIDAFDTLWRKFISRTAGSGVGQRKGWRGNNPRVERRNFSDPSVKLRPLQRRRLHRSDIGRGSALRRGMVSGDDETATSPPPAFKYDGCFGWPKQFTRGSCNSSLEQESGSVIQICAFGVLSLWCGAYCGLWSRRLAPWVNGAPRAEHLNIQKPFRTIFVKFQILCHITSKLSSHNHDDAIPT